VRVYLDHNASAPLRPEAHDAMAAALDVAGNPSSAHREGARARALVEQARADRALIGGAGRDRLHERRDRANNPLRAVVAGRPGTIVTTAIGMLPSRTARALSWKCRGRCRP
jgi:hypothetical protein